MSGGVRRDAVGQESGEGPLSAAARVAEDFGGDVSAAADAAAGAAGEGPLAGALNGYGDEVKTLAEERARVVIELRLALLDAVDQYREADGSAAERSNSVDFG